MAREEARRRLQESIANDAFEDFMQELRERGHVGLANEGLWIWDAIREPNLSVDLNDLRDRLCVWRGWLDWEVRMARPQLQANVSTWNVGPLWGTRRPKSNFVGPCVKGERCSWSRSYAFPWVHIGESNVS